MIWLIGDGTVIGVAPNIEHMDPIWTKSLDLTLISSPLLPTIPSHLHAFHESPSDAGGHNPSFDPYCAYLEDMPRKTKSTTFFDHYFDFSITFDKCKRALNFFAMILLMFSYSHHFETHAKLRCMRRH